MTVLQKEERYPGVCGKQGGENCSGIPFGKKVNNPVNVRGVTDVTHFHVKIDEAFQPFHLHGQGGAVGQVIDQGLDLGEVNGADKNFFHSNKPDKRPMPDLLIIACIYALKRSKKMRWFLSIAFDTNNYFLVNWQGTIKREGEERKATNQESVRAVSI
jgi:hypothetical protein